MGREDEEGESASEWSKGEAADVGNALEIGCREVKDEGGELSLEQEEKLVVMRIGKSIFIERHMMSNIHPIGWGIMT